MLTFLIETLRLGIASLLLHKLRSLLTALGIIIGVAVVIIVVAAGEGSKQKALDAIRQLGARNIILRSVKPVENVSQSSSSSRSMLLSYGLLRLDLERIEKTVAPVARIVPLKRVGSDVTAGALKSNSEVYGTTPDLPLVTSLRVERGRYLTDEDMRTMNNVAVLGASVATSLFPLQDPIGQTLRISTRENIQTFTIIGVLRQVGLAGGAGTALVGRDLNFDVHIPLTTAQARFGDMAMRRASGSFTGELVEVSEIYVEVANDNQVMDVADKIRRVIDIGKKTRDDVSVFVPLELLEKAKRDRAMFNALMTVIAAVSLLVGGIGIMNIMLASVTERTREIGIRRALGATQRHIVAQFLTETTLLASIGGVLGVAVGMSAAPALIWLGKQMPALGEMGQPQITLWSIIVSVLVATTVGVTAGLYPAIKAALQDPIVALRHD
ncbi:MAG: FtsX-like permease family protein [Phycisphaera sp.]|nr:FtsX-like permease family protein [Phycisphaera sp.]